MAWRQHVDRSQITLHGSREQAPPQFLLSRERLMKQYKCSEDEETRKGDQVSRDSEHWRDCLGLVPRLNYLHTTKYIFVVQRAVLFWRGFPNLVREISPSYAPPRDQVEMCRHPPANLVLRGGQESHEDTEVYENFTFSQVFLCALEPLQQRWAFVRASRWPTSLLK